MSRPSTPPEDVVEKVLRRAEVAKVYASTLNNRKDSCFSTTKMARKLHDRLALASYKTRHGQENLSFRDVEARLDSIIRTKRNASRMSSSSSSSSEPHRPRPGLFSDPLNGLIFSGGSSRSRKRPGMPLEASDIDLPTKKRPRSYSMAPPLGTESARASWKSNHDLPQSSPVHARHESRFSTTHGPNTSFASEIPTIPNSPLLSPNETNRQMLRQSFNSNHSYIPSSPPRTPPPTSHRRSRSGGNGEEGADLLLYLATSPSPARTHVNGRRILAPSTPPSKEHSHFAAALHTPAMLGANTPGQQFNMADFVNITPSPAQGAFGSRTPCITKTPLAAREARRHLNFDTLAPPGSPPLSNVGRGVLRKGLAADFDSGGP